MIAILVLLSITFYTCITNYKLSREEFNQFYPLFYLILSLTYIYQINNHDKIEILKKMRFLNYKKSLFFITNKPFFIIVTTILCACFSILSVNLGLNLVQAFILILVSVLVFTSVLFTLNYTVNLYLFWINFYLFQLSIILSQVNEFKFLINNFNPLGSLISNIIFKIVL